MKIAVLNPGGRDPEQAFTAFAGEPDDGVHAPVNFHAFAACTGGSFHMTTSSVAADQTSVLLLLRPDLKGTFKVLEELKSRGKTVAVTWKETGGHQIAQQLNNASNLEWFRKICAAAHGAIATTPESLPLYRAAGAAKSEYIPTPYPMESAPWNFSIPISDRRGVFIGTREWDVPSRNHLAALMTASTFRQPVTVFNCEGRTGRKKLGALGIEHLEIIENRLPYSQYLRKLAKHRIVWQLDSSCVPGQVAGDAALCRVPCFGGNGAIDREVFPALAGHGRAIPDLMDAAARLLADSAAYESAVESAASLAQQHISFPVIDERLNRFFSDLAR